MKIKGVFIWWTIIFTINCYEPLQGFTDGMFEGFNGKKTTQTCFGQKFDENWIDFVNNLESENKFYLLIEFRSLMNLPNCSDVKGLIMSIIQNLEINYKTLLVSIMEIERNWIWYFKESTQSYRDLGYLIGTTLKLVKENKKDI